MLQIEIPDREIWNQKTNEFISVTGQTLQLEHSLISISKWEEKWKKPFLIQKELTNEQGVDYIRCMTMNKVIDPNVYLVIPASEMQKVNNYIQDPASATKLSDRPRKKKGKRKKRTLTSEVIYSQMVSFGIPLECQKWRLNRLLTLIRLCAEDAEQDGGGPKRSREEAAALRQSLNASRRAKLGSKG